MAADRIFEPSCRKAKLQGSCRVMIVDYDKQLVLHVWRLLCRTTHSAHVEESLPCQTFGNRRRGFFCVAGADERGASEQASLPGMEIAKPRKGENAKRTRRGGRNCEIGCMRFTKRGLTAFCPSFFEFSPFRPFAFSRSPSPKGPLVVLPLTPSALRPGCRGSWRRCRSRRGRRSSSSWRCGHRG